MIPALLTPPVILSLLVILILGGILIGRWRMRATAQLLAAEQRWKLLFEQSPLSIQIFAPDGQTIKLPPQQNLWVSVGSGNSPKA